MVVQQPRRCHCHCCHHCRRREINSGRGGGGGSGRGEGRAPNGHHNGGRGSGRGGRGSKRRQAGLTEGPCHQASTISGQPVVPCERRLLWRTAPTPTKIHRPSPNCAAGCGRITSCRGVHRGGRGRQRASEMNNRVNKMWSESSGDYLASRRPLR